jgi:hypothetical protein
MILLIFVTNYTNFHEMKNLCFLISIFISSQVYAQDKALFEFFQKFQMQEKQRLTGGTDFEVQFKINIQKENYIEAIAQNADSTSDDFYPRIYTFALWKTQKGKQVAGVFGYDVWTGSVSNLHEFRFFDDNMNDMTEKVIPIAQIKKYFNQHLRNGVTVEQYFWAEFPTSGSTIQLSIPEYYYAQHPDDNAPRPTAQLIFEAKKGVFRMRK